MTNRERYLSTLTNSKLAEMITMSTEHKDCPAISYCQLNADQRTCEGMLVEWLEKQTDGDKTNDNK
jgi:hypothetical protein